MQNQFSINKEGIKYATISKDAVEVSRDQQITTTNIIIPPSIEFEGVTYHVKRVGSMAFFANKDVEYIHLPDSITEIGEAAFSCCESLVSVNIPEGIETIPYEAFYGCQNLKTLFIPDSVSCVEDRAFWNCSNLQTISIPKHLYGIEYPKIFPKRVVDTGQCRSLMNLAHCYVRFPSGEIEEIDVE